MIMNKLETWNQPESLAAQMDQLPMDGTNPEWLTEGRTVLILRTPRRGQSHPTTA